MSRHAPYRRSRGGNEEAMDQGVLGLEIHGLSRTIKHYLALTMPEKTRIATGGNTPIIMYLNRHRDSDVFQYDIEKRFCITSSTASRVLALMEKKGLIRRESVASDARVKKITLTGKADAIVEDLAENAGRMERRLLEGFTERERDQLIGYLARMRTNIDAAQQELAGVDRNAQERRTQEDHQ